MGKYISNFETTAEFEAAEQNLDRPHVSLTKDNMEVHFMPWSDPRVIATFNVTDTSSATRIMYSYSTSQFSVIEIDGVEQPSVVSTYTFDTLGEHTIKYTLTDPTSIGNNAFNGCTSLTSIVIPSGVTSIGDGVFFNCSSLTSIDIPSGVTSIGIGAFQSCSGLTSVTLGNGVTSIGAGVFQDCSGLTTITIPNTVTSIGIGAFDGCSSLTSIVIPNSVTSIRERAFRNCSGLTSITVNATTPPTISGNWYEFDNTNNCPIYVPSASVNTYKAASGWSVYSNRIQAIS